MGYGRSLTLLKGAKKTDSAKRATLLFGMKDTLLYTLIQLSTRPGTVNKELKR